jgi:hypothetical protein
MIVELNQEEFTDMYYVYAIGLEYMLLPPYNNCYIGVTNDVNLRWKRHEVSKYTVGQFIRSSNLEQSRHMVIIFEGSANQCFDEEARYRPYPMMGLNEASGGRGGHSSYNVERNEKISRAMRGKTKSKDHVEKISKTIIESGSRKGKKNGMAKKWVLTSPDGIVYNIHGSLTETCKNLNLLESALRYSKGALVPEPSVNGHGGYRAKTKESFEMRTNTTGWCLKKAPTAKEV